MPGHQPGDGEREGDEGREKDRRSADQSPIDDPRCEAKQNAHDRSVYGRGHVDGSVRSPRSRNRDGSALQAAQRARDELLQHLVTPGPGQSGADELPMDADQKERGAVVRVDVVVEFAADSCPLDLGGQ
jgi:hypothetical protein